MTSEKFRLECLRLAVEKVDPREAVVLAEQYAEFVLREARPCFPLPSSHSEDMLQAPNQHQPQQ
jgi:hypothetical protein